MIRKCNYFFYAVIVIVVIIILFEVSSILSADNVKVYSFSQDQMSKKGNSMNNHYVSPYHREPLEKTNISSWEQYQSRFDNGNNGSVKQKPQNPIKQPNKVTGYWADTSSVSSMSGILNRLKLQVAKEQGEWYKKNPEGNVIIKEAVSLEDVFSLFGVKGNITYEPASLRQVKVYQVGGLSFRTLSEFGVWCFNNLRLFIGIDKGFITVRSKEQLKINIADIYPYLKNGVKGLTENTKQTVKILKFYEPTGTLIIESDYDGLKEIIDIVDKMRDVILNYEYKFVFYGVNLDKKNRYTDKDVFYRLEGFITPLLPIEFPDTGMITITPAGNKVLCRLDLPYGMKSVFRISVEGGQKQFVYNNRKYFLVLTRVKN